MVYLAMMRYLILMFSLTVFFSCQKEELSVQEAQIEEQQANALNAQLMGLIQTVASHDGAFDDVIDNSACYSINFPYTCFFNGELYAVNSAADLVPFANEDNIVPEFPVTITYANYENEVVNNLAEFQALAEQCNNGNIFNEKITCLDVIYPVTLALYDSNNSSFDSKQLSDDKETFLNMNSFPSNILVSINYPIEVTYNNGTRIRLTKNDDLETEIITAKEICN